jgi:hypothetical protein
MPGLFQQIRAAVDAGRLVFSLHADERLRDCGIASWQVSTGLPGGRLLVERPNDRPNPVVEVEQTLAGGTRVKSVWAWLAASRTAKLVTVHFFDR